MHTHHGSGQMFLVNGLNVLLFLTLWRVSWFHIGRKFKSPLIQSLAKAAFVQAG